MGEADSLECCFLHLHGPGLSFELAEDLPLLLHMSVHAGAGCGPLPILPTVRVEARLAHHYTPVAGGRRGEEERGRW